MRLFSWYVVVLLCVFSCKKDAEVIIDNDAPYYGEIPTILLENYVNRLYIDLLGREPLDNEMEHDVQYLRDADVTLGSRDSLLYKLQFDTIYIEGDSSYKFTYFHRIYEMIKVRLLEGASNAYIAEDLSTWWIGYQIDSSNNDLLAANKKLLEYQVLNNVLKSELEYYKGEIGIEEMHRRMIYNSVYDKINMNTFNFINAAFDNLLFRYPTQYEFDECYKMIDDNSTQLLLGSSGNSKYDMTVIMCNSQEFYEGLINWTHIMLLGRQANPVERNNLMLDFILDNDYQKIQRNIMQTDEYAHFN